VERGEPLSFAEGRRGRDHGKEEMRVVTRLGEECSFWIVEVIENLAINR
jgi:hypothetical protein